MGVIKFHHPVYPCKSLRRNYNDNHIPRSNHRRRRDGLRHRILPRKSRRHLHYHRERRHRNPGIRLQRRRTQSTARRRHPWPPQRPRRHVLRNAQRPRPNPRRRIRRRVPPQDHRIRHRSLRRLRHPRHAGNPRHLRRSRRIQRPLARRIRPPRDGTAPQPRSPARHLRIR